jgi:AcrR family transcriptional regulator
MVEVLVAATARVLVKRGYDRATTNHIAVAAGVSIGSLYQYFPSKDALVAALIDTHVDRHMDVFRRSLAGLDEPDLRSGVQALIEAMLQAHNLDPQLHAVLSEQVPKVGRMKRMHEIDQEAAALILEKLESHRSRLQPKNLELAAFMIVHGVEGILHALAVEPAGRFEANEVVSQLSLLVTSYLSRPASPGEGGASTRARSSAPSRAGRRLGLRSRC